MSARSELEVLFGEIMGELGNSPEQALNLASGDEAYNINIANFRQRFNEKALLLLADRIDALERG